MSSNKMLIKYQINNLYESNIVRKLLTPQHKQFRNKLHLFDQIRTEEF